MTYRVVLVIPARLALPGIRACRAIGDWHSTSIRVLPLCRERTQIRSRARHSGRVIDVFVEDKRGETRSSGQEMAKDKRIDQGEKSERLSSSIIPVSSVLLHHTYFPFEALQAYLRPFYQRRGQ